MHRRRRKQHSYTSTFASNLRYPRACDDDRQVRWIRRGIKGTKRAAKSKITSKQRARKSSAGSARARKLIKVKLAGCPLFVADSVAFLMYERERERASESSSRIWVTFTSHCLDIFPLFNTRTRRGVLTRDFMTGGGGGSL